MIGEVANGLVDEIVDGGKIVLPDDGLMGDLLFGGRVTAPRDATGHNVEKSGRLSDVVWAVVDEDGGFGVERLP